MKMKLEKGDLCFVRMHNGDVVEAKYDQGIDDDRRRHWVRCSDGHYIAGRQPMKNIYVRFQYPLSEMKRQMGLQ